MMASVLERGYWVLRKSVVRARGRGPSERILKERYARYTGKKYDPERVETLTDHLFERMLRVERTSDDSWTPLVDKVLAKEHFANLVSPEHVVPTLWSGDPGDIPFGDLEPPYVVKANHNSGGVVLVRGTPDEKAIRRQARRWMKNNYYWHAREYQYLPIRPQVLVEHLLADGHVNGPLDYKCWCFHGEPAFIQVATSAHDRNSFYDTEWNLLDLRTRPELPVTESARPARLDVMLDLARTLSAGHEFVRVDLYEIDGHAYVGELTFTPISGNLRLTPPEWDLRLGQLW